MVAVVITVLDGGGVLHYGWLANSDDDGVNQRL